ncbi:MAG: CoA transferase [Candidatus Rokubacteria bacterium]|nr:CoA transferase [Candidatus Rokubacteria bacterium]MBI3825080.1 CoA transferase [Candidatus Rokubacteria bacterium]
MSVLAGLTVLDVGTWIAGPAAATVMSDFGADVIKIEAPDGGDTYRAFQRMPGVPESDLEYSWLLGARNKRSVALDLTTDDGRDVLLALVQRADVFLTNFTPARLARLKLTWDEVSAVNPRLVFCSLTAYGETGEEASKTGFDINAWWARSGLMDLVRAVGAPPANSMPGMGDFPTAMTVFGAIMLGLYQRERTGQGARVSTSLLANGAWANSFLIQAALAGATFAERRPREQGRNALTTTYRCRDDRWFVLSLMSEDKTWPAFTRAIERPDLLTDPRFARTPERRANAPALIALLDEVFAQRDWDDWRARLDAQGLTFGAIARLQDVTRDPQMASAGVFPAVDDAGVPGLRTVASPISVAGATKATPRRAPRLGEHTHDILKSLGYDDTAIRSLRQRGVIGP